MWETLYINISCAEDLPPMKMEAGILFIQHLAPYGRLQTPTVCRLALKRILSFGGYELPAGQGFHITRKTFATRLLEALNKIDDISNALGHVRKETSEVYPGKR